MPSLPTKERITAEKQWFSPFFASFHGSPAAAQMLPPHDPDTNVGNCGAAQLAAGCSLARTLTRCASERKRYAARFGRLPRPPLFSAVRALRRSRRSGRSGGVLLAAACACARAACAALCARACAARCGGCAAAPAPIPRRAGQGARVKTCGFAALAPARAAWAVLVRSLRSLPARSPQPR